MNSRIAIDPDSQKRGRCVMFLQDKYNAGVSGHPQAVIGALGEELGFIVTAAIPQSVFDAWEFWIEWTSGEPPQLPEYFDADPNWLPPDYMMKPCGKSIATIPAGSLTTSDAGDLKVMYVYDETGKRIGMFKTNGTPFEDVAQLPVGPSTIGQAKEREREESGG